MWQFGDINPCEVMASFTPKQLEQTCPACRSLFCHLPGAGKANPKLLESCTDGCSGHRRGAGSCQCCCLLPARPGFLNLTGATPFFQPFRDNSLKNFAAVSECYHPETIRR